MANLSGKDGSVTFATGWATDITDWTIDAAAEEVETTVLGDKWKTWIPGVKEWSGSYTALADDVNMDSGSTAGYTSVFSLGRTSAAAVFKFGSGSSAGDGLSGSIIITGVTANVATGGTASSFSFTFRGDGTLSSETS